MAGLVPTQEHFTDPTGTVRIAEFIAALSRFPTGHLLDLGAGHGLFSRVAADLGWRVTAVDARDVRFPEDSRVNWVVSDIRDFTGYEDVSVVACLGLWYHLTLADQLALLRRIAPRPLVLDTHVARDQMGEHPVHGLRLSPILDEGGFAGRLYSEADLQHEPTASWGNDASFWPTIPSLQRQLEEAGYDHRAVAARRGTGPRVLPRPGARRQGPGTDRRGATQVQPPQGPGGRRTGRPGRPGRHRTGSVDRAPGGGRSTPPPAQALRPRERPGRRTARILRTVLSQMAIMILC